MWKFDEIHGRIAEENQQFPCLVYYINPKGDFKKWTTPIVPGFGPSEVRAPAEQLR